MKTSSRTIITPAILHSVNTREVWIAITILVTPCGKYHVLLYNQSKYIFACNVLFISLQLIRYVVCLYILMLGKRYFRIHKFTNDDEERLEDLEMNRAYQMYDKVIGSYLDQFITTEGIYNLRVIFLGPPNTFLFL